MSFILFLTNKFQMFASDSWSADIISLRLQLFSLALDDRTESEMNALTIASGLQSQGHSFSNQMKLGGFQMRLGELCRESNW